MTEYGFTTFGIKDYRSLSIWLTEQARGTDNGLALVTMLISEVRHRRIVVPTLTVIERLALACRARARREAYSALSRDLTPEHRAQSLMGCSIREASRGRHILAGCDSRLEPPTRRISSPAWSG